MAKFQFPITYQLEDKKGVDFCSSLLRHVLLFKLLSFICGFSAKVTFEFIAYKQQCRNSQK